MRLNSHNYSALTLVELLVVLGIIVILSAFALVIINPSLQRSRARDAVLKNTIGSIGQAFDSYYSFHGFYPDPNDAAQVAQLRLYLAEGFTLASDVEGLVITKPGVFTGGVVGGPIRYYVNDFPTADDIFEVCIQGASNEDPALFVGWAPNYSTSVITSTCDEPGGYNQLLLSNP